MPNLAKAFLYCETKLSELDFDNILKIRWGDFVGKFSLKTTTRTEEFNNILEYILKSKPGLFDSNLNVYGYSQEYLKKSGCILEYYQFMKCYELMLEYERENNIKFDIIIRSRLDLILTQPINLINFFGKIDNDLFKKYGEEIYIRSLGNENMANQLKGEKVVKLFEYEPFISKEISFNSINTLKKINSENFLWTFYCNWIWVAKRHTMEKLYPFVYFYGNFVSKKRDYFNSENQFFDYLKFHNCNIFHFFTQEEWDLWTKHEIKGFKTILENNLLNPEIDITQIISTIIRF